ncbi:MAG: cation diffusion facilitator family transporter [Clostridiales Family XIII bacterium]|jgi:cation diffusion facilitator family transporter|nr:cation diffusion facilitator family transporter [Clostridiales Family XIII bacterium]
MKNKAIITALSANTIIAVMKFIVAFISGSASMLSEGIHSAADTLNQVVLLVGMKRSKKLPDAKHPFGYARAVFFASFCVASLLFFVGGAFSLLESIEKIGHAINDVHPGIDNRSLLIAAGILAVSIVLESISLHTAFREVREEQEKAGTHKKLLRFYRETSNSPLIVIVTEDIAAVTGLGIALAGVLLTYFTKNPIFDAIGGAAIGVLLILAAFILGREIASLIIGEALPESAIEKIRAIVEAEPLAAGCENIKTVIQGSNTVLVEVDVIYPASDAATGEAVMASIVRIKQEIKALWAERDIYVSTCVEPVPPAEDAPQKPPADML